MAEGTEVTTIVDNMAQSKVTEVAQGVDPGQSVRGWSPEVTARHPKLVNATMIELAESGTLQLPNDPHQIKDFLRNAAIKLNYQRLADGLGATKAEPSAEVKAALAEVLAELRGDSAAAAPAAEEPAAATTKTTRTSSTSSASS